jgi:pimeloyl-ACP methyl ester carboxylesterase
MDMIKSQDGTTIAYDKQGEGPAVIVVDGALSVHSSGGKSELANLLAPHFTVYGYDRRGRGGSGDTPPYAVDREIEDIEALIDHAGGSAFLYGHVGSGPGDVRRRGHSVHARHGAGAEPGDAAGPAADA